MRIDELAREAGTTVRNVRAYRERGLLPAPRRAGRVGLYSDAHLARLRLIGVLLQRGYSIANIAELLAAWERGQDLAQLLGLEAALGQPWGDATPAVVDRAELQEPFAPDSPPGRPPPDVAEGFARALRMGLIEWVAAEEHYLVHSPAMLRAGAELARAGVPLSAVLDEAGALRAAMERVAGGFVEMIVRHVVDPLGPALPTEAVPRLADLVHRLRPLVRQVVDEELARAMEQRVEAVLSDWVRRAAARPPVGDDASVGDGRIADGPPPTRSPRARSTGPA